MHDAGRVRWRNVDRVFKIGQQLFDREFARGIKWQESIFRFAVAASKKSNAVTCHQRAFDVHVAAGECDFCFQPFVERGCVVQPHARLGIVPSVNDGNVASTFLGARSEGQQRRFGLSGKCDARFEIEFEFLVAAHVVKIPKPAFTAWQRDRMHRARGRLHQRHEIRVVLYERDTIPDPRDARRGSHMRRPILRAVLACLVAQPMTRDNHRFKRAVQRGSSSDNGRHVVQKGSRRKREWQ